MSQSAIAVSPSRLPVIGKWGLQILLAVVFLAAAAAKLSGVPMMVDTFEQIGIGQWFRYVTACVEILGAVGLLVPGFAALAGLWLGATMTCAALTHVLILHSNPLPAVVLLVLTLLVALLRRDQLAATRARI